MGKAQDFYNCRKRLEANRDNLVQRGKAMNPEQILPIVLIVIQLLASVPYFIKGDLFSAFYWLFAGLLNVTVTFRR